MLTTTIAGRTWDYSHSIGGNRFTQPTAAAYRDGVLYVLSRAIESIPPAVNRFTRNQVVGMVRVEDQEYLSEFGAFEFTWPADLALDKESRVYVSDEAQNKIAVYSEGRRVAEWGEAGTAEGRLNGPAGVDFDDEDNIYVVDSLSGRVQKFTGDGRYLLGWGSPGTEPGRFTRPWGITVDRPGNVYVADWGNDRVQKFTPDGEYLLTFGGANAVRYRAPTWEDIDLSGEFPGSLNHPSAVAVDGDGDVYVADWGNRRLQIYAPDGEFLTTLWGDGTDFSMWAQEVVDSNPDVQKAWRRASEEALRTMGRFHRPVDVLVADGERIMVLETNRRRVQIYDKLHDYAEAQLNL